MEHRYPGSGFGARRFLGMLKLEGNRLNHINLDPVPPSLLQLARRMLKDFGRAVSGTPGTNWNVLLDESRMRIMIRPSNRDGFMVVSAISSFILPTGAERVLEQVQEMYMDIKVMLDHVVSLKDVGNYPLGISLLRADNYDPPFQILKQTCRLDDFTSLLVYTDLPKEEDTTERLASGFAIQSLGVTETFVTLSIQENQQGFEDNQAFPLVNLLKEALGNVTRKIVASVKNKYGM